jgi:hypothetical protein
MSVLHRLLVHYRANCKSEDVPVIFHYIALWFTTSPDIWSYKKFYDGIARLNPSSIENFCETIELWKHSNDRYRTKIELRRIQKCSLLFIRILNDAIRLYDEKKFDQLIDIIDIVHALPSALINTKWDEQSYVKTYLDSYKKRYGVSYADLLMQKSYASFYRSLYHSLRSVAVTIIDGFLKLKH